MLTRQKQRSECRLNGNLRVFIGPPQAPQRHRNGAVRYRNELQGLLWHRNAAERDRKET